MPYLKAEVKIKVDKFGPASGKELAYCFARDINTLLKNKGLSADTLIEVEGALRSIGGSHLSYNELDNYSIQPSTGQELLCCFNRDVYKLKEFCDYSTSTEIQIQGAVGLTSQDVFNRFTKVYEQTKMVLNGDVYDFGSKKV